MDHAWLDSLSEDWVSQPDGDASIAKLPPLTGPSPRAGGGQSRIPRRAPTGNSSALPGLANSSPLVLNERSANQSAFSSRRLLSKDGRAASSAQNGHHSPVVPSSGSVVHNSPHRRSASSRRSMTPEWKRRLVHGKLAYGEQRDLFSSAAAGLQDIFKPPPSSSRDAAEQSHDTLPSSPPGQLDLELGADLQSYVASLDEDDSVAHETVSPSPSPRRAQREIKFRLNVGDDSSAAESLRSAPNSVLDGGNLRPASAAHLDPGRYAASQDRKISGQSDMRNEDFSPILIGKQSDHGGRIEFVPIQVPVEQLHHRLERLRLDQMQSDSQEDVPDRFQPAATSDDVPRIFPSQDGPKQSWAPNDVSFYNRGLSSDLAADSSEMLPEESLQASTPKQFPTVRTQASLRRPIIHFSPSPTLPRAPFPSPDKNQVRQAEPEKQAAGSPLKLFGPYDTFTNQTLLRRISQFEEASSGPSRASPDSSGIGPQPQKQRQPLGSSSPKSPHPRARVLSRFGKGELDGYEFERRGPCDLAPDLEGSGKEKPESSPCPAAFASPHASREQSPAPDQGLFVRRRRNQSSAWTTNMADSPRPHSRDVPSVILPSRETASDSTPHRDGDLEGKRPRTSPTKDPTPKRRRTLHRSDVAFGRELHLAAVGSAHRHMQSVMSDQHDKGDADRAEANPPQPRSIHWPPRDSGTASRGSSRRGESHAGPSSQDAQAQRPSSSDSVLQGRRAPSIRTQDFVDQAAHIMAMIRNQVKPGLASLEESEVELDEARSQPSLTASYQDSTTEPLSRPPSRDGRAPLPRMLARQEDPEVLKRLERYQELSDAGDLASSSRRSSNPKWSRPNGGRNGGREDEKLYNYCDEEEDASSRDITSNRGQLHVYDSIITDLPCVRITPSQAQDQTSPRFTKDGSGDFSTGRLTSRTFPSTSSRGSESRKTIMPESVLHLIPDRVGSMYLDKQHNIWVKRRGSDSAQVAQMAPSEDSEDDPFASIPDLSVDITKELRTLGLNSPRKEAASVSKEEEEPRSPPKTVDAQGTRPRSGSYVTLSQRKQKKPQQEPDLRMASAAKEQLNKLESLGADGSAPSAESNDGKDNGENTGPDLGTKRRNLTISFSSPIASIIHDVVAEDLDNLDDDPDESLILPWKQPRWRQSSQMPSSRTGGPHGSARGGPDFVPRPVSRIDEQDEESTVEIPPDEERQISLLGQNSILDHRTPNSRHASLSFIINHHHHCTPHNGTLSLQAADESAMIGRNVGRLSLSPLSEFTLDNPDQSFGFEVSYVMGRHHLATGDGSKQVLSMTIRELVDKLGEVEPYEPFWEDMMELDLHGKQLTSLHMLDEFCGCVVRLDASANKLGHLDGVPSTVRQLKVSQNLLTELTSWDHLMNLQYVDVSGNEVKSLSALKKLVHLRSIKADDNQLTSLDGLDLHDGLLSLRARNNAIETVNFSTLTLERLTDLDLDGNNISAIERLDMLPALSRLRLRGNKLQQLRMEARLEALRELDVSDNDLTELYLGNLPNVRSVRADRNRMQRVSGFERARRLDSLSLREQRGDVPLDMSLLLGHAYEIRKLFLSGNYLGAFEPTVDFLNLQLLELANCGLQHLPPRMGQLMPNLRTLNINFNAVADLSPLRYLPRLKKLLVAGNRLGDATAVTQLLMEFPHLTRLDVRDNPMTLGFYPPAVQMLLSTTTTATTTTAATAATAAQNDGRDESGSDVGDVFSLPDADAGRDALFASRLDEATRLRRRLHQAVLAASCARLRRLDGLEVKKGEVLARDGVMAQLLAEGLVTDMRGGRRRGRRGRAAEERHATPVGSGG